MIMQKSGILDQVLRVFLLTTTTLIPFLMTLALIWTILIPVYSVWTMTKTRFPAAAALKKGQCPVESWR